MVDDLSALGLRHVGYGVPIELFGPFTDSCVEVMKPLIEALPTGEPAGAAKSTEQRNRMEQVPNSNGLQPTSDGLQPTRDRLQPKSDALQPRT